MVLRKKSKDNNFIHPLKLVETKILHPAIYRATGVNIATWKRRVQGEGLTIDAFCKELKISTATFRSKNPTLFTVSKIELAIQGLEEKGKNHGK